MRAWASVAAALALLSSTAAQAEWVHQKNDDPFQGDQHLALTSDFLITTGFRCSSAGDLSLIFVMPQKPEDDMSAALKTMTKKLLVIIDGEPKVDLQASLDRTPDLDHYRLTAEGDEVAKLAFAAAGASKRFAIAAEINGEIAFSKSFDVDGSTSAIGELIKGCKLEKTEVAPVEPGAAAQKMTGSNAMQIIAKALQKTKQNP